MTLCLGSSMLSESQSTPEPVPAPVISYLYNIKQHPRQKAGECERGTKRLSHRAIIINSLTWDIQVQIVSSRKGNRIGFFTA